MNGYQYILAKQTEWAKNQGLDLIGSKINRGRPTYTTNLDYNLFQPLLPDVRRSFAEGDGSELGSSGLPGKMQAVHSSSAIGVNVFQYWKSISAVPVIAAACGLCRRGSQVSYDIHFEEKYPIKASFGYHPNIDVVIHNTPTARIKRFAIECKFSEAYGAHKHGGLKSKYLEYAEIWSDIPNLRAFAERISPEDRNFMHLHPAQLVKHILGLKRLVGIDGFRLLYLWYDVLGEQGKRHRDEAEEFSGVAKQDGIKFHSLTYQELIITLANQLRPVHNDYIRYLTERYL
ncbi:MAG: hypothetical protein Q7J15_12220 [Candidatus Desulfaltia sp.]|nr:hypothetical protein [Candidatus Desulfaltia sp.]